MGNVLLHTALQHHNLISISCQFTACKALLVWLHISIATGMEVQPFTFTFRGPSTAVDTAAVIHQVTCHHGEE